MKQPKLKKNHMKRIFTLVTLLLVTIGVFAQQKKLPMILDVAEIEENDVTVLSVFNMPDDEGNHFYLCVGTLGIGDEVVQLQFDPLFQLFLPIGSSIEESLETLETIKAVLSEPKGTSIQMEGCLAAAFPNDNLETVTITRPNLVLGRKLMFSLERDGYIRATHVSKMNLSSIISSVKFYHRIHPNE